MKRWLRRTVVAVVLVLVARTVWLVGEREWVRREGESEYAAAVAATDAADPGWRWDDLADKHARLPDGRNGMDVVFRAKSLLPTDPQTPDKDDPLSAGDPPVAPNVRLPAATAAAARARLATVAEAVAAARTLKDFPHGAYRLALHENPIQTLLPHVDAVRRVGVYLRWDGILAADDGDIAAALDSSEALLNLGRTLNDPFLISQLVRISDRIWAGRNLERILAQGEPDPRRLAVLQAAWAAEAEVPLLLNGLRGERAVMDQTFEYLMSSNAPPRDFARGADGGGGWFGEYGWWLYKVRLLRDRAALHTYLSGAVAAAQKPFHEQRAALAALTPPRPDEYKMAALLCPAVEKQAVSCWRAAAQARCVVIALACERFRRADGRWPDALAELVPAYLSAVPLDPFDGQSLRYKRLPDGAVVYSIGANRLDDEGDTRPTAGPIPADEGFRLWNPDARRRPAPDPME